MTYCTRATHLITKTWSVNHCTVSTTLWPATITRPSHHLKSRANQPTPTCNAKSEHQDWWLKKSKTVKTVIDNRKTNHLNLARNPSEYNNVYLQKRYDVSVLEKNQRQVLLHEPEHNMAIFHSKLFRLICISLISDPTSDNDISRKSLAIF